MLPITWRDIGIRTLGNRIIDLHMSPNTSLLGRQHSRTLLSDVEILVHYIKLEHRDRCCNLCLAVADTTQAATTVEAKTHPHVHIHHWFLVCYLIPYSHSQMLIIY